MRLTQATEGFLLSRTADVYSPITLRGYRSSLGTLAEYLNDPEVDTITTEQLKGFMHQLHTTYKPERKSGSLEPLSTASYHHYWKAIRSFFKWASEDLSVGRPDLELKMPKFTNKEYGEVFVLPHHIRKTRLRTVFIGKVARKAVWRYLTLRDDARPEDPLFITAQGRPMSQESIKSVLYAISLNPNVVNVHPHRFRHTFAIQFLRNGGDVFMLQRLLGHATFEMVKHYLALSESASAEAHRQASRADRWNL